MVVTVNPTTARNVPPGVCTEGGRRLPGGEPLTVDGPASFSVADATAEEGTDENLAFVVTLSRPRYASTTVNYATADVNATAARRMGAGSGRLATWVVGRVPRSC